MGPILELLNAVVEIISRYNLEEKYEDRKEWGEQQDEPPTRCSRYVFERGLTSEPMSLVREPCTKNSAWEPYWYNDVPRDYGVLKPLSISPVAFGVVFDISPGRDREASHKSFEGLVDHDN